MLADERLELGDERCVLTESEVGFDPPFQRHEPQLLEPPDLALRERLVREVVERRAPPQPERLIEQSPGFVSVAAPEGGAALAGQPLEAAGVHLLGPDVEEITAAAREHDAVAERLSQAGHVHLHRLRGRVGRPLAPDLVDQAVDGYDLAAVEQEDGEDRTLAGASQRQGSLVVRDLQRAEYPEVDHRVRRGSR